MNNKIYQRQKQQREYKSYVREYYNNLGKIEELSSHLETFDNLFDIEQERVKTGLERFKTRFPQYPDFKRLDR